MITQDAIIRQMASTLYEDEIPVKEAIQDLGFRQATFQYYRSLGGQLSAKELFKTLVEATQAMEEGVS